MTDAELRVYEHWAARHGGPGVGEAHVRALVAEVRRLRHLLTYDHAGDCSALTQAVPCDCPWDAPDERLAVSSAEADVSGPPVAYAVIPLPRCGNPPGDCVLLPGHGGACSARTPEEKP